MPLSAFDTDQVYDESLGQYVAMSADTLVFACFKGLPMDWSWSMHFCNSIAEDCLRTGISRALGVDLPEAKLFREGRAFSDLRPGLAIGGCYVDNANIIAPTADLANRALQGVLAEFDRWHLVYHEVVWATPRLEALGVVFDFSTG